LSYECMFEVLTYYYSVIRLSSNSTIYPFAKHRPIGRWC